MKNLNLRLLTVATLALISFAACKKSKDSGNAGLSATINGTAYSPSTVVGLYEQGTIDIDAYQITGGDTLWLSLEIPDTAHVNNSMDLYNSGITYTKLKSKIIYEDFGNGSHASTTLTTFDKTNKKIAGKFSGTIYAINTNTPDSIVITNGQFNTSYK